VNAEDIRDEKILRWAHGEMTPDEQQAFAQALQTDQALRRSIDDAEQAHRLMKLLVRKPDVESEAFADTVLQHIDADPFTLADDLNSAPNPLRFRPTRRVLRNRVLAAALAVAACLAILLGPGLVLNPLVWAPERIINGTAYRHNGLQSLGSLTEKNVEDVLTALKTTVDRSYRQSKPWAWWPRREWTLLASIQEIRAGRLALTVVATSARAPSREQAWTEYYLDMAECRDSIAVLGERIGQELGREENHATP